MKTQIHRDETKGKKTQRERRSKCALVRLTPTESDRLAEDALAASLDCSTYIRKKLGLCAPTKAKPRFAARLHTDVRRQNMLLAQVLVDLDLLRQETVAGNYGMPNGLILRFAHLADQLSDRLSN